MKMAFAVLIVPFQDMTGLQGKFCYTTYSSFRGIDHFAV
jgi:hypothetical protein